MKTKKEIQKLTEKAEIAWSQGQANNKFNKINIELLLDIRELLIERNK